MFGDVSDRDAGDETDGDGGEDTERGEFLAVQGPFFGQHLANKDPGPHEKDGPGDEFAEIQRFLRIAAVLHADEEGAGAIVLVGIAKVTGGKRRCVGHGGSCRKWVSAQ